MPDGKLLLVTPARDEAGYIAVTIESVLRQSLRPAEWIIVDDGSTDATFAIAEKAARSHAWIQVLRKPSRPDRRVGIATVDAMALARTSTRTPDYDFLAVVDADIDLPAGYFEEMLKRFAAEPALGIAAGQIYDLTEKGKLRKMRGAPQATAGAVKCWRRCCLEAIGGPVNDPAWDGIDRYQAGKQGWNTRTFDDQRTRVVHLRPVGTSHRGICQGSFRRGKSGYYMGSHPLWMLASALFHVPDHPFGIASLCTLAGYFCSLWRHGRQAPDKELLRFVRSAQLSKLRDLALGTARRGAGL